MALTYSTLVLQIESYLNRNDAQTIAQIPYFIDKAQQRLARELPTVGNEQVVVTTFEAGNPVYAKPARWRSTLAMNYGSAPNMNNRKPLLARSYDYLRMYWSDDTQTDPPEFYADYNYSNWLIAPTPDQDYPCEISYLELPELLSVNNQVNFWTNYLPDILLYCSLLEATPFLKNTELIPSWVSFVDRGIKTYKAQNHSRLVDRQSYIEADKGPPGEVA